MSAASFESHKTGVFRTRIVDAKHPAMKGVKEFEAWDETYVHHRLTGDRHVLMVREEDGKSEPWTWVRTQGKGRVFYTASGHDQRVFRNAGFHRSSCRAFAGRSAGPITVRPQAVRVPSRRVAELSSRHRLSACTRCRPRCRRPRSMKHLSVPGGFRVELFAAEPDIVKPITIAWDDRGRRLHRRDSRLPQ